MTGNIDPALFGMPDANTAGVQAGVTLKNYSGPMTITTPGAVIENVIINGTLTIAADNVTIRNCVIQNFDNWGILSDNAENTRVEYCDIDGTGSSKTTGLGIGGGTNSAIIGCDIRGMVIGINMFGAAEIKDNYIHDLAERSSNPDDRHFDGIRAMVSGAVIEHNTIALPTGAGGTTAIFIKTEWGAIDGVTVKGNLLTGDPSYTIYVESTKSPITNVTIEDNYVEKGIYGYYNVVNSSPVIRNNVQWNNSTDPTPYPNSPATPSAPTITSFSTDSGVAGDKITNDNTLTLTGTAAAGSTVKVYDGTTQIGVATANSSGTWTFTTATLSDSAHTLKATATTSSGQSSAASAAVTITIDTKAPVTPTIASNTINGSNQVVLSGNAEANSTIKVFDGSTQVGTATTNASGAWSLTTSVLTAGTHTLTAKATDAAGNVSGASSAVNPVIGSGSPGSVTAPTIASFSTDSGVAGDKITNDNTLTLTGTAAANTTIKVFDGSTQVGTATTNSSGQWTLTTSVLRDGDHNLTATATNASGQTSAVSTILAVKVDATAPTAPTLSIDQPVAAAIAKSASPSDFILTGTAEANSTVKVFDGSAQIGTAKADASGAWTLDIGPLSQGTHSFTATATDVAGNASTASTAKSVSVSPPTTAPSAPTIATFSQDSGVAGDKITNDKTLTLTGTAAANTTIKVMDGTTQVGTATTDSSGKWTLTTSTLKDGDHSLTAIATNASGQSSAASTALTIKVDATAPTAPTLSVSSQAGASVGSSTSLSDFILKGTAEANSTVKVFDGTTQIGTAKANSSGAWTLDIDPVSKGTHSFTATATDVAGNASSASTAKSVSVTTSTAPTKPGAPTIATFSQDSGVAGDKITNDKTLTLTGTATANTTIKVMDGSTQVGTAITNSSGQWTLTTSVLKDGGHSLTATATNASGLTSVASTALPVTIDTKAPTIPTVSVYSQSGAAVGGSTSLSDFILKGTAEANSTVKVFDGTTQIGTAKANASGAWSLDIDPLNKGTHSFTATATDVAGNASTASMAKNVSVTAPSAPAAPIKFNSLSETWGYATIKGTADPNSLIKLFDGKTAIGTVTSGSDGSWTFWTKSPSDALHTFTAKEIDSSGKVLAVSDGQAILGSSRGNVLTGTSGDDYLVGNGSADTFVFAPRFGNDVIKDFDATGRGHDTIQFSSSVFDSFASVLAHASQVGQDVVIAQGADTLTLKNVKLSSLNSHDFQFA